MRVVHPNDSEPCSERRQVSGVVATLLSPVPAATIHLDDYAPFDYEIHSPDARYPYLRCAREPRIDERYAYERLDAGFASSVEHGCREAMAHRHPREDCAHLVQRHQPGMQSAVDHRHSDRAGLATHQVSEAVREARAGATPSVNSRPPMLHRSGLSLSGTGAIEVNVHARVGRVP